MKPSAPMIGSLGPPTALYVAASTFDAMSEPYWLTAAGQPAKSPCPSEGVSPLHLPPMLAGAPTTGRACCRRVREGRVDGHGISVKRLRPRDSRIVEDVPGAVWAMKPDRHGAIARSPSPLLQRHAKYGSLQGGSGSGTVACRSDDPRANRRHIRRRPVGNNERRSEPPRSAG